MIDFFHLSENSQHSQVFYTNGTSTWQVWQKPNSCKIVSIFCLGGGGGGGAAQSGASGTTRRGGGGGGSASYSIGMFAASQIPDTLFLRVAQGGAGGVGGSSSISGGAGTLSYVSIQPNTTTINVLLASGGSTAPGGGGSGPSGGAGGVGGTAWGRSAISYLGQVVTNTGQAGGTGQTNATPSIIIPGGLTSSGAGGAGTNLSVQFDGGAIAGAGFMPQLAGGINTGSIDDRNGSGGYNTLITSLNGSSSTPLFFSGGSGGASANLSIGGDGGAGAFGCGGGGGGVGVTAGAGYGGRGGDGLVIINCY